MTFIDFGNVQSDFAVACVNRCINTYLSSLHQNLSFKAKLENLVVTIHIVDYISTGCLSYDFDSGKSEIILEINPSNSKKFISFIIAHEFAHFLFQNPFDVYCLSGRASDESTNFGAIQRLMPSGETYGYYFEELLADYIAHFIVSKLNYDDIDKQYTTFKTKFETKSKIISNIESLFGNSLFEGNFIDEYTTDEDNIAHFNYFWSSILSFSFNNIVNIYDEVIGKNEFHSLCNEIDNYCEKDYNNLDTTSEKEKIFAKINLLAEKLN